MAADIWTVLSEEDRLQWSFTPLKGVGPLKFGMTHAQTRAAVSEVLRLSSSRGRDGEELSADFWLDGSTVNGPAVTVYYDRSHRLAGIALNALRGPQVRLDGIRLVGQVPSSLEDCFGDYLQAHEMELRYSQCADPCSTQFGLVLRVQRAGDKVLSRPVFVASEWAEECWDTTGSIPQLEWKTFEW